MRRSAAHGKKSLRWGWSAIVALTAILMLSSNAFADQRKDEISSLARKLGGNIQSLLNTADVAPKQRTAMQQRTRDSAVTELQQAVSMTVDYEEQVRQASDIQDTEPAFKNVREAITSAIAAADDADATPEAAEKIGRIDQILMRLSDLYAESE